VLIIAKIGNYCLARTVQNYRQNDSWRASLSCVSMIRLLARPFLLSLVSKLERRDRGRVRMRCNLLTGDGGRWVGVGPNNTTARKPGHLLIIQYSLLNYKWRRLFRPIVGSQYQVSPSIPKHLLHWLVIMIIKVLKNKLSNTSPFVIPITQF
jgi:hypothetical protein